MIDIDKYEGHTPAPWRWKEDHYDESCYGEIMPEKSELNKVCRVYAITEPNENETMVHNSEYDIVNIKTTNANRQLLADAPLLLAEVKRLREELRITQSNFSMVRNALANQYPEIEEAIWKVIE